MSRYKLNSKMDFFVDENGSSNLKMSYTALGKGPVLGGVGRKCSSTWTCFFAARESWNIKHLLRKVI